MGKLAVMVGAIALLCACGSFKPGGTPELPGIEKDSVSTWVESDGTVLPVYEVKGQYYLLGLEGRNYQLGISNKSDVRVEVVVSVDGLDVITGQVADYTEQRGYVLAPGEQIRVEGFRQSLDAVAAFAFTTHEESYASRIGKPTNVGVIGIAVFDEEKASSKIAIASDGVSLPSPVPHAPVMESATVDDGEGEERASQSVGTSYGETVDSTAEIVPFKRCTPDKPIDLVALFYNDRAGLERVGVVFPTGGPLTVPDSEPEPFPGSANNDAFAQPPTN